MSKERAQRRAVREAAQARDAKAQAAKLRRRQARQKLGGRLAPKNSGRRSRPDSVLRRRRRRQDVALLAVLLLLNALLWTQVSDWKLRVVALVLSLLLWPLLVILVFDRRPSS